MNGIWVILQLTFLESIRRKTAIAAFLIGMLFLILFSTGFHFISREAASDLDSQGGRIILKQVFNTLILAGLYAVNFLTLAMGALISADTLSGEIGSGTIQTIATKPLRRSDIVLGKWLGYAVLLLAYEVLLAGGVIGSVLLQSGYMPRHLPVAVPLLYSVGLLMMTLSLAFSSTLSTLATGASVFGLYAVAFIGGWVEQIGAVVQNQTAVHIGILTSLLLPAEALWRRAAYEMSSPFVRSAGFAAGPFAGGMVASNLMLLYSLLYLVALLAVAIRRFNSRDL